MSKVKEQAGALIRVIRKKSGISQEMLSEMTGIKQSYISKLEQGKVNVTIDYLEKIAQSLNKNIVIFFKDMP